MNGGKIPPNLVLEKPYDQVQTEVADHEATVSRPILYKDDIYYIEVAWPDYAIANSNKKVQLILGMYFGDNWDPSNDWSHQGIKDLDEAGEDYDNIVAGVELAEKCPYVCVYADGKLVGGTEPDGTTPEKTYSVAQLIRLLQAVHNIKPFDSAETAELFDFHADDVIDIFDVAALKRLLLNE